MIDISDNAATKITDEWNALVKVFEEGSKAIETALIRYRTSMEAISMIAHSQIQERAQSVAAAFAGTTEPAFKPSSEITKAEIDEIIEARFSGDKAA